MRNNFQYDRCTAEIGSVTDAMRARSLLASAGLICDVIQGDSSQHHRGCVYAISYNCGQERELKNVLKSAGIRVRSFYGSKR